MSRAFTHLVWVPVREKELGFGERALDLLACTRTTERGRNRWLCTLLATDIYNLFIALLASLFGVAHGAKSVKIIEKFKYSFAVSYSYNDVESLKYDENKLKKCYWRKIQILLIHCTITSEKKNHS